jgi:hypothetical protein
MPVNRIIQQNLQPAAISATEGARSGNFGKDRVRDPLLFSGLRWPAAQVTGRRLIAVPATGFSTDAGEVETLVLATTGQGQHYQVDSVEGWWRDFAEILVGAEERVVSFVRRRGDPLGELTPDRSTHTGRWAQLLNLLHIAALGWEHRNDLETSKFIAADDRIKLFLSLLPATWASEQMGLTYRGLTPMPVAHTLTGYLVASAISALRRQVPMRRCLYCSSWFELHRREAMYCSPSCRAAHFNQRISPHGIDFARHHAQRDDTLASPLAGAGRGQKVAHSEAQKLGDPEGSQSVRRAYGGGARAPRRRRSAPAQHR